jgi:hypothetical protein
MQGERNSWNNPGTLCSFVLDDSKVDRLWVLQGCGIKQSPGNRWIYRGSTPAIQVLSITRKGACWCASSLSWLWMPSCLRQITVDAYVAWVNPAARNRGIWEIEPKSLLSLDSLHNWYFQLWLYLTIISVTSEYSTYSWYRFKLESKGRIPFQ